jgi:pyridoxal phosphate enzyme (YggS family)
MVTEQQVRDRLGAVEERIRRAGGEGVRVVGVTKGHPASVVRAAVAAGIVHIGENYAQEWRTKAAELGGSPTQFHLTLHFIGQLQTNKVRMVADIVDVFETVDRPSLVDTLATRVPGARVLLQVDLAGEPGRGGCRYEDTDALLAHAVHRGLVVEGLMGVAPFPDPSDRDVARRAFERLSALRDELGLAELSMGMSDDLEDAVAAGSTSVRIGTALFGSRPS